MVLMGDACHAVRPFMAAGGSMAIEDAAILSRCIAEFADPATAFARYAAIRIPRVADIQQISIDTPVLVFTLLISLLVGLAAGFLPALGSSRWPQALFWLSVWPHGSSRHTPMYRNWPHPSASSAASL